MITFEELDEIRRDATALTLKIKRLRTKSDATTDKALRRAQRSAHLCAADILDLTR